ncbi:AraC family transcriptional regulator [Pseudoruegeria sp. M32A2M]|nr:AraC family transcriptional regulator [Pseudoruegeria sp. M32A2M]
MSFMDKSAGVIPSPCAGEASGLRKISTMRQQSRGLPVREGGIVFLGKKPPAMHAFKLAGRNTVITRMHVPQAYSAYNVPDPEWITLHIPLSWDGSYVFDGREARAGEAFLTNNPNGYTTRGENRDALTLGPKRDALEAAMRSMFGHCADSFDFRASVHRPSPMLMRAIATQIDAAIEAETSQEARQELHFMHEVAERDFLDVLALEFRTALRTNSKYNGLRRHAVDVVAEARQLTLAHSASVPSLSEICAATRVGQTRLFECFQEVHGLAPYKCLMSFRLCAAHERLTDKDNPPHSVKQVAMDAGFTKAGRFAQCFFEQFGERPSEVLGRTRAERMLN